MSSDSFGAKGGALETVVESKNASKSSGLFFGEQSVESVVEALDRFEKNEDSLNLNWMREHCVKFSETAFKKYVTKIVETMLELK